MVGVAFAVAAAGADLVVAGALSRVGPICLVSLYLWPLAEPQRAQGVALRGACDPDVLAGQLEQAAQRLVALPPLAAGQPSLAVGLIESRGSPFMGDELVGLTDHLAALLAGSGKASVVPRHRSFVDLEPSRDLQAAASHRVNASISKVGSNCLVTASLFDVGAKQTAFTASVKKACEPQALVEAVE